METRRGFSGGGVRPAKRPPWVHRLCGMWSDSDGRVLWPGSALVVPAV